MARMIHSLVSRVLLVLTVCAVVGCTGGNDEQVTTQRAPARIRIGYQVVPNGELLAKAMGLAQKAFPESKVEYVNFTSGRDVNMAMAASSIDFGLVGSVGASIGISQELPYDVYFIHSVIGEAEALVVRPEISSVAELAGKKLAVPFGSTTHFSLLSLLAAEKISSATVLDLQPQEMVAAWQRRDIDAGYIWLPHMQRLLDDGGKVLLTSGDMAKRGTLTADLGIVRKEFATHYPHAVKRYVAVLDEAIVFYLAHPGQAAQKISTELGLSPEQSLRVMSKMIWLNSLTQRTEPYLGVPERPGRLAAILKSSADFMVAQKNIPAAPAQERFAAALRSEFLDSSGAGK